MNTKIIMTASAITLGAAGLLLTFAPDEILTYLHLAANKPLTLLLQILGAMYFAFAMLNWMTRTSVIGGIYNKPIVVANLTHFLIAGLAITKGLMSDPGSSKIIWITAGMYGTFAISFGFMFFTPPVSHNK